jgi:type VI secretion system protein ImpL
MRSYRADYAQAWADLIADVHLKPAANNQEAIRQAEALGAPEGPLALLIAAIVRNTPAALPDGGDGPIAASDPLAPKFTSLARLTMHEGATGTPQIEGVLQALREVAVLRAAKLEAGSAQERIARIATDASSEPEPVRSMLLALAVLPKGAAGNAARLAPAELSRQVAARLAVPCIRLVAGHFPFARGALRDASLEDFARLFAPKAGFDQAFAQLIGARVDTSSDTWEVRGPGPGPQAADVERFRAAARIRDVFFRRGGMRPAIELKFRPLDMDQEIDRFQLEVDGQIVSYAHGPVETTLVRWPGPQAGSARIELTPASATDPVEFSGPWALFRLLDNAAVQDAGSPGRFRVVFGAAGHQATFEVESDSGANPFRLRELEHFDCPLPGP